MHGSIFVFLKRFVESKYDHNTWLSILESAGIKRQSYELHEVYPDDEINAIIKSACAKTGLSSFDIQVMFGEAMVPDLLMVYDKYINPSWKTLDMIEYTEQIMHKVARVQDPGTEPPVLHVTRVNKNQLIIDYYSKRKMAGLAIGIIKGIANFYNESDVITVESVTEPYAERVQIKVDKAEKAEG